MQPVTQSSPAPRGRWAWRLIGTLTLGTLAVLGATAAAVAGHPRIQGDMTALPARTVTVAGAVTSVDVTSYGAPIRVVRRPVSQVRVTEAAAYDPSFHAPAVTEALSGGRLTLAAPSCQFNDCWVGFTVTAPSSVAVTGTSDGGDIIVSGTGNASLDSGGGTVKASDVNGSLIVNSDGGGITVTKAGPADLDSGGGPVVTRTTSGPLDASTDGGSLQVTGESGSFTADTGGGPADAGGVSAQTVRVDTDGGSASVRFTSPPQNVQVSTDGGPALLVLPGGPYLVSGQTDGALSEVSVPASTTATRTIVASTDGGSLRIMP